MIYDNDKALGFIIYIFSILFLTLLFDNKFNNAKKYVCAVMDNA